MSNDSIASLVQGELDAPFWEAWTGREQFLLHRCAVCGRHDWPASCCVDHGLAPMIWVETPGAGVVDTFTIFHKAYVKDLASEVPLSLIHI